MLGRLVKTLRSLWQGEEEPSWEEWPKPITSLYPLSSLQLQLQQPTQPLAQAQSPCPPCPPCPQPVAEGAEASNHKSHRLAQRRRRSTAREIICPRCGQPGVERVSVRGRRKYIYVYHGRDERNFPILHYVGPAEEEKASEAAPAGAN